MKKNWALAIVEVMLGVFAASAENAKDTNYWIGPSGGSWGADANWSLNHVPTADECVDYNGTTPMTIVVDGDYVCWCFNVYTANTKAPLTLTGSGSITASGSNGHYSKKPLTLDGVSLALNGRETLFYASVTIKNGGKLTSNGQNFYSWSGKAEFLVEDGEISCGPIGYACQPSAITLKKGSISCTAVKEVDRNHKGGVNITIEGGSFTCSGEFLLTNATSFAMNGGALAIGGSVRIMDTATLALNGGAITNSAKLTVAGKRLVTESKGTTLAATATGVAVDICDRPDETLTFTAPFAAPNGQFVTTNRVTLVSDSPFEVKQFYYGTASSAASVPVTLKLPKLIARESQLFDTSTGNARNFNIDGPLTIRPTMESMSLKTSRTVYLQLDGEMTVDTRDWNDPSVSRSMGFRNIGSRDCNGSLVIRGGGSFYMTQLYGYNTFKRIVVEEGTTLEVGPFENSEYGPLGAEKIVLGANAVLKIDACSNTVHAAEWDVDPTAKILVSVASGFSGGQSVLRDYSGALTDISSQVVLSGEGGAEGCAAVFSGGSLAVVKPVAEVDGTYSYEWTGNGGSGKWSLADNWHCQTAPVTSSKTSVYAFGCADTITSTDYDNSGAYLGQIIFRNTAVKSFTITSPGERTFFSTSEKGANTSSVYSESALPQYFGMKFRRTGANNGFSFTAKDGPIVITSTTCYPSSGSPLCLSGDIRVSGSIAWPQLSFWPVSDRTMPRSQLTILEGGSFVVTNQTKALNANSTALVVKNGGSLTFYGKTDGAFYQWSSRTAKHVVDGTLTIDAVYRGGQSQIYGGSGVLSLSSIAPASAAASLTLEDALALNAKADWTTVAKGADYPLTLKVAPFATPRIAISSDWTYGPSEDAEPASSAEDRALVVARESVLTVDAGGFAATFADPVKGEGTLAVSNGTVKLSGGAADLAKVRLEATGTLETEEGLSLGAIVSAGGTLRFTGLEPIALSGAADVTGLKFEFADGAPARWTTLLTAPSITGTVASSDDYKTRIVETDGGYALQGRMISGALLLVR